ncbi:hypothetical protein HK096_002703, partial [Nowakowskiella sp. JEL0078]
CARIVADYLNFEPLDPPHELPQMVPSPTYVLKLQSGNCYDYSILLVSLLRGVGYDAYVVSGYATRELTTMDETRTSTWEIGLPTPDETCAHELPGFTTTKAGVSVVSSDTTKYKIKTQRHLKSLFLMKQEEKKKLSESKRLESLRAEEEKCKMVEVEEEDDLKGLRIHAWVLVLPGKREIAEPFFIEPSTGRKYSTDNENFLGVESVASSQNYWVNVQVCYDGLKGISFDLGDNVKWEFVLLDNTQPGGKSKRNGEANDAGSDDEEEVGNSEILDLPPSWVDKLMISKEQFESRCPSGSKCVTFSNARVETFADYHRADGMVSRITFFINESKNFNGEIHETFENRRDKLRQRIRIPYLDKIHEFFDPGRPHGLKEHIIVAGKTIEMHFYSSARSDGLIIEHFTDREDLLIYKSETFENSEVYMKMTIDHTTSYEYTFAKEDLGNLLIHQDILGNHGIGSTIWDSALVLAKYLEKRLNNIPWVPHAHRFNPQQFGRDLRDRENILRIVELGSGTGLVGIVVAKVLANNKIPSRVVLTDKRGALPLLQKNVDDCTSLLVDVTVTVEELDWTEISIEGRFLDQFDIILAADCIHWPELFDPLISTMLKLSDSNTEVIISYERREFDKEVEFFRHWGNYFGFRNVPVDSLDEQFKAEDIYVFTGSIKK